MSDEPTFNANEMEFLAHLSASCDATEGGRAVFRYAVPRSSDAAMQDDTLLKLCLAECIEMDVDRSDNICYFVLTKAGLMRGRDLNRIGSALADGLKDLRGR